VETSSRGTIPGVFISYVSEDETAAIQLGDDLSAAGVRAWRDKDGLRSAGGTHWEKAIEDAIRGGDFFVACFSPRYWARAKRTYMNRELDTAIRLLEVMPPETRYLIPVRLAECEVPDFPIGRHGKTLRGLERIDMFPDWEAGLNRIIGSVLASPALPPDVAYEFARIRSRTASTRQEAAESLGRIGGGLAALVLAHRLTPGSWEAEARVRRAVVRALWRSGSESAWVISRLIQRLQDPSPLVGQEAAWALGSIGKQQAVGPWLAQQLETRQFADGRVADASAWALGEIGGHAAIAVLEKHLLTADGLIWWPAADALCAAGSHSAVPALTGALRDREHPELHARAAENLLLAADPASVPALVSSLVEDNLRPFWTVVDTLVAIGTPEAVCGLIEVLRHGPPWVRSEAARGLGVIGDQSAVPALIKALRDRYARSDSAIALGRLQAVTATPSLVAALEDRDPQVRWHVAIALGLVGDEAAVPALAGALTDPNEDVRGHAAQALGRLRAIGQLPRILEALADGSTKVRRLAAEALGEFGSEDALPALAAALDDVDHSVRKAVAAALERLRGSG
jgi:HEAT repeat protein